MSARTTMLTPNRRLAARLHKIDRQHQINNGRKAWVTPDILPINNWFQRLFNDYLNQYALASPLLLTSFQEEFIWEQIILSTLHTSLLQLSKMVEMVQAAWTLSKEWHVDMHHPLFNTIDDCAAFQSWATLFQKMCTDNDWLDHASLPDFLMNKMIAKQITLPDYINLFGFTELSPQWKKLFAIGEQQGVTLHMVTSLSSIKNNVISRTRFSNHDTEITTIARFAKTIARREPDAMIGCVVPTLEKTRDRVMQIFSEVFSDEKTYGISINPPFNISAGKSLSRYPIIHTALLLLNLYDDVISSETFSYLLRSPFLGEAEAERMQRARFDYFIRKKNINIIYLKPMLNQQNQPSLIKNCPSFARRIQQFLSFLDQEKKINGYGHWSQVFHQSLSLLGWPGERSLNSEEYQVVENWFKTTLQLARLDDILQPIDIKQALKALQHILDQAIFQIQTPEASIQILGTLEAAALPFDYLWVAGMDDRAWPPQAQPNPFIPRRIQRTLHMPHATAERELFYCQQLIQQFKQSAREIIFSHAEMEDDLPLQVSPLIQDLPEIECVQLKLDPALVHSEYIYHSRLLEKLVDDVAPPLPINEVAHGGVNVIKQQALCPFKAFAEIRLYAQPLESPLPGLRAKDRGTLLHLALEKIWEELHDHQRLLELDETALNKLIDECIIQTIDQVADVRNKSNYFILEKKRLHRLIYAWLQIEKNRQPFTVSMQEKSVRLTLDKLTIAIRIDRIDEFSGGKKLIIDYKTGKHNHINNWFGDRPEDPQLPLYALLDPDCTIGVSFAELVPGGCGFKGVSQYSIDIKGINPIHEVKACKTIVWQEQIVHWKNTLHKLSNDFYDGVAHVDPKDPYKTCLWCALKPLCRINEASENNG
ncbi:MAG: hypothetical protein A3F42_05385 [Gammaproteobacteria bacterium RIFCSPHIGHO2_12_FULL_37_34]|nr:MAG: hypothetical protein A3F42_05385 [Gammaproteobacteria bacterium RIFCSPHIGHO2_12_FULL_37_34]